MTMMVPDAEMIAQVLLQIRGFTESKSLGQRLCALYRFMRDSLSDQKHYDFSLRAVMAVLRRAGDLLKLEMAAQHHHDRAANGDGDDGDDAKETEQDGASAANEADDGRSEGDKEEVIMLRAITELNVPKLVASDEVLFADLMADLFPISESVDVVHRGISTLFRDTVRAEIERSGLQCTDNLEGKVLELYQAMRCRHGNVVVGPSNGGKTAIWNVLKNTLNALSQRFDGRQHALSLLVFTENAVTF